MSFVLVSPSTEIRLNDFSVDDTSAEWSNSEDMDRSVVTNASIVAIFGAIIPDLVSGPRIVEANALAVKTVGGDVSGLITGDQVRHRGALLFRKR